MCGVIKTPREGYVTLLPGSEVKYIGLDGKLKTAKLSPFRFVRWETLVKKFPDPKVRHENMGVVEIQSFTERDKDGNYHEFKAPTRGAYVAVANHNGTENVGFVTVPSEGTEVEPVHGRKLGFCREERIPDNIEVTGVIQARGGGEQ